MPRTRASGNPWRMLNVARLPAADFGAGVVMIVDKRFIEAMMIGLFSRALLSCENVGGEKSRGSVRGAPFIGRSLERLGAIYCDLSRVRVREIDDR